MLEKNNVKVYIFTRGDGSNIYFQLNEMTGGRVSELREKHIMMYDTSLPNSINEFFKDIW